jgi:hypothetical protein
MRSRRDYSSTIDKPLTHRHTERSNIMNVLKHMEAAFLFALGVAAFATVAVEAVPPAQAAAVVESTVATPATMAVVKVSAKRMSAAEKAASLAQERALVARI